MNEAESQIIEDFKRRFISVETEVHFDKEPQVVDAFFGGFFSSAVYEDGLATRNFRDYEDDSLFDFAYRKTVNKVNRGLDPHIRWRCRIFEYFMNRSLPGHCVELGAGRGFMMHFALGYLEAKGGSLEGSKITMFDKFDQHQVDVLNGKILTSKNSRYPEGRADVSSNFVSYPQVSLVSGLLPDELFSIKIDFQEVRFIHVDLNSALTEVACLKFLLPKLKRGCKILLDDYGFPEFRNSQKEHGQLAKAFGYEILALPTGQGLIEW